MCWVSAGGADAGCTSFDEFREFAALLARSVRDARIDAKRH